MGYHKMTIEDLYSIFSRWNKYQNISQIASNEGFDRKTIRGYIKCFYKKGYQQGLDYEKEKIIPELQTLLPNNKKSQPVRDQLQEHKEEIANLMIHPTDSVKINTAFRIIKQKYDYEGSYETFKLFVNRHGLKKNKTKTTLRIELPAGLEIQIDYGKVGTLFDPSQNKNRTVYAFCGILAHSRLPFIEFVFTQNQVSFVQSNVNMVEFFDGTTEYISLDNLKSGVIKPDLYDPKINRTYQEMAEHYGVFINPCRVATPTDKGKIERFIQVAREIFKELKYLHPDATVHELNQKVKTWCKEEYGANEHGTTGIAPYYAYEHSEKNHLKPLPDTYFEICRWHNAKVHRDQFIEVNKKRYSLPVKYVGASVWVKQSTTKVFIYQNYQLLREYVTPKGPYAYEKTDFPRVLREMLEGGYPKYLLNKARTLGEPAFTLINTILTPHAYLNARRARGVLDILDKYHYLENFDQLCEKAIQKGIKLPKSLKILFKEESEQLLLDFDEIKTSETGKAMVRGVEYYLN